MSSSYSHRKYYTGNKDPHSAGPGASLPRLALLILFSLTAASVLPFTGSEAGENLQGFEKTEVVYEEWQLKGLTAALDDPDPKVRRGALDELSRSGKRSDIPGLPALLKDKDPLVRRAAIIAASGMGESARDLIPSSRRTSTTPTTAYARVRPRRSPGSEE